MAHHADRRSPPLVNPPRLSERAVIFLIGAIQFVSILDFVMVMPLGPDFAHSLGFPESLSGAVAGSYAGAAALAGFVGSFFFDRFDRRRVLIVAMLGLVCSTFLGGFATGLYTLMAARVLAGLFGGPVTSVAFSIIMDIIPAERRGRAFGAVAGAFSIASIVGIPIALKLAEWSSWRMTFWSIGGIGALVLAYAWSILPPMTGHLAGARQRTPTATLRRLIERPVVRLSYLMTAITMAAGFMIIPNIAAHLQLNLGFPRASLGQVYFVGGIVSFAATRLAGRLNDSIGAARTALAGCLLLSAVIAIVFIITPPGLPVVTTLAFFFLAMGLRNVSHIALASQVPRADERAGFMSLQSTTQHLASAAGSFGAAQMLTVSDGRLVGIHLVAAIAIVLTLVLPLIMHRVERCVRTIHKEAPPIIDTEAMEAM